MGTVFINEPLVPLASHPEALIVHHADFMAFEPFKNLKT